MHKVVISSTAEGKIVCYLTGQDTDPALLTDGDYHVIPRLEIFNVGDLKWLAMLLGMEDMSNIWCIYCFLRKLQWMQIRHERSELRTMARQIELANDPSLKGAERYGVKFAPLWEF